MTWQLGSTIAVMAALAAGFAWYERGRPSSKLVALVAALAALAVAGRVVFAAIPNVQATTDVVLLSGYALGVGPGFAVGAVCALVSNLFLGQGPWTPWQMLGWGVVGVGGAALARVWASGLGRQAQRVRAGAGDCSIPPRVLLALVCAVAGLAFGAWMDLFTLLVFTAERSLDGYVVVAAAGLPFNIAHAVGNLLLCLAFGPGFLRLLLRFRRRFEIEWEPTHRRGARPVATPGALVAVALAAGCLSAVALSDTARAAGIGSAVRYLERAQNRDGGFGGAPGQRSSELVTGWTVLGLEAAGRHPLDVKRAGRTPIDFMRARSRVLGDTGELERTILALRGAGFSASLAGHALMARLLSRQRRNGSFEGQVNLTAFGILALRAVGRGAGARGSRRVRRASKWLARQQNRDGGFSFARRGGSSDVDDTGAVLQAFAVSGRRRTAGTRRALAYLLRAHKPDGGFGQLAGTRSNAQSTAWAAQGLVAAGVEPSRFGRKGRRSPLSYLASLQQGNGSFRYSRTSDQTPVWVTAQVIIALKRKPFPFRPVRRASQRGKSR